MKEANLLPSCFLEIRIGSLRRQRDTTELSFQNKIVFLKNAHGEAVECAGYLNPHAPS